MWTRDNTGANSAQNGSITMTGFAPVTNLPVGTVLTGARLKVTHRSTGNQNKLTFSPNLGPAMAEYTMPARTNLGTEDVDLSQRTGWGAFQKAVHDQGFTGASVSFKAELNKTQTAQLDAVRLELTYYVPQLRGQTTTAIPGNTVATVGRRPVIQALGNSTTLYIQGTTLHPAVEDRPVAQQHRRVGLPVRGDRPVVDRLRDRFVRLSRGGHRAARQLTGLRVRDDHRPAQGLPVPRGGQRLHSRQRRALADGQGEAVRPRRGGGTAEPADLRPELEPSAMIEAELPMVVAMALLVGVLGSAVGSFLNVVAHRVPRGQSVVNPPSACPDCGTGIRSRHNVPVVGWLVLRGRCYDCGSSISARYPLVEAGIATLFVLAALRFADEPRLLPAYLAFAGIGGALALIDLDVRRLPNSIVLPAYPVLGVLLALDGDAQALLRAALGAAVLFVFYLVVAMVAVGAMGFGDVKLAGVIGGMTAYLSWGTLLSGAFLGFFLGAVAGLLLIAVRRAGRRSAVPFGPFMLLGAWTAVLGAGHIGDYYLALLAR